MRDYVYDGGQPYLWREGGYTVIDNRYRHADRLGSVAATTNASGAVTAYADGPYGEAQTWAKASQRRRRAVELGAIGMVSTYSPDNADGKGFSFSFGLGLNGFIGRSQSLLTSNIKNGGKWCLK